jgi:Cu2+-containing amine oxidase
VRRTSFAVVSFEHVPDVTPNFTLDEFHDVDIAMRQHPDVIARLAARGFTDMSLILVDVWTYGKAVMPEQHRHRRLGWCDLWARQTPDGNPFAHPISGLIPHAICLHEEDNAVLWKHVDAHTGAEVRRQRRMVVSCHATVANYEYLIYWRFYRDGNIECEVRATGLMVATPYPEGAPPPYGTVVDENTYAPREY